MPKGVAGLFGRSSGSGGHSCSAFPINQDTSLQALTAPAAFETPASVSLAREI
ncbi:hypothetical protein M9M90_14015 [Phenylobacterium sp. LH3H17]|uniref:hypothetical protein n=1 Tax=Phenylobacterium sp. LH3H17 TaxID=2903901 RepID=UPI0020C94CF0|nr:hypothetical protein [Phenylobacterium sp. LH3H17]UTP38327.1 hypothetical protein M9M90_14015 [Phenylobacterium sp. LH3H17]